MSKQLNSVYFHEESVIIMKGFIFLVLLISFRFSVSGAIILQENPRYNQVDTANTFLYQLKKARHTQQIDSLELVFSAFIKEQLTGNRLKEGHAILNQLIADVNTSDTIRILAYKNKAILYGQEDLSKKRKAFEDAIRLIEEKKILKFLIPLYQIEISKTYLSQSDFSRATFYLNKVDLTKISNPEKKVEILGVVGVLYAQMDDTIQAIRVLNEAISISKKHKDYFGLGTIYSTLGNIYGINFHQSQRAITCFRHSMNAFHQAGYDHYALGSQTDIGVVYSGQNKLDSALYYLQKSYRESIETGSVYDQSICAKELGIVYNRLHKPELALKMCREAKQLIWDYSSDKFRYTCASCLSEAYESLNEYDSSLYYFKLYHAYLDSTLNKDETKAIAKFNAELEKQSYIAKQEKINLEKDHDLEQRNTVIAFLSVTALLILALFLLILRGAKNRKKRELIAQQEQDQRKFSQDLLQSLEDERKRVSMELHDSVGQMLVVAGRNVRDKQLDSVEPMLQHALNEVRSISQGMHPYILDKLGLEDAILHLIQTTDQGSDLFIESEVDLSAVQLKKEQEIHIYRILQELISNAVKHSESPSLFIQVLARPTTMEIRGKDRGKGFDVNRQPTLKKLSLGWKTLHERVALLNGDIQIISTPNQGTDVHIQIPLST